MNPLTAIYAHVRDFIHREMISDLNDEITRISINGTETDILLAWLTATSPVKSKLPARCKFFKNTKRILKIRGELERGLLDGLK